MTKHILIVDPSISFAVSLKRALEDTGEYAVRTVARIKPAIAALQETPHQLAVIDLDLDFASPTAMVRAIRTIQPEIPVILASIQNEDRPAVEELRAQAFIKKPFLAKDLIPLIEETIQRGFDPHEIATQKHIAQTLEAREKEDLVDPLLEASRNHPDRDLVEPPITADDSTISEVIEQALNPEVSRKIYTQSETQPAMSTHSAVEPPNESDEHMEETTPALETLSATLGTASLDSLLEEIRAYASGQAGANADDMFMDEAEGDTGPPLSPIPTDEETRDQGIPKPPRLPELREDVVMTEDLPIEEEELVPTTVEEMTERITVVELEEVEQELANKAKTERIDERTMARYALQLTLFSMESSSMGAIITRDDQLVAHSGGLEDDVWDEVIQFINENWNEPGDARTRVLYRHLPIGEALLYSIQTVGQLTLTLIFAADTSLKVIRRQAARLAESLNSVPEPDESVITAEPTRPMPAISEPEAGEDIHEELREGVGDSFAEPMPEAPTLEQPESAEIPPTQPKLRAEGTYANYACVWLVERKKDAINPKAARLIESWLADICDGLDWDLQVVDIQPEWLYVELGVPAGTLPSLIASTLMEETAERAMALDPSRSMRSPWSNGYLIRTPPENLQDSDIDRFVNFYRSTQLQG